MSRKTPPSAVARQLRQEAGCGCAVCGNPLVAYHHIIEWSERQHFEPEHMVALCPNHHAEYGKLAKSKSYSAKKNPINLKNGRIKGYLGGHKAQKRLRIGGMTIGDCKSAISYSGISLFSYRLIDGEYSLNSFLPAPDFWPEIEIKENAVSAWTEDFWDIEFKTNWIKFRRAKGEIFLSIDFRGDNVEIDGNLELLGESLKFGKDETQIGTGTFSNIHIESCGIGLGLGPRGRLLPPNYAMAIPKLKHLPFHP